MSSDRRTLSMILVIVAALWLMCWPFADMAVNDDFTYAFTVRRLLETGKFTYNGWSSAILGPQALWAALLARTFGFSHDVLRLSTLPFSLACGASCYFLHRRLRLSPRWSAFATLCLVTSPIFTPWSASFMTDVPGLAFTLGLVHLFVSLRRSDTARAAIANAAALAAVGLAGGTVRQSLLVLAAVALGLDVIARWRERRSGTIGVAGVAGVAAVYCACALALIRWAFAQPYFLPETLPPISRLPRATIDFLALMLDGTLYAMPLLLATLPFAAVPRRVRIVGLGAITVACLAVAVALPATNEVGRFAVANWTGGTLSPTGLLSAGGDALGVRPTVFPHAFRVALAIYGWSILATLAALVFVYRRRMLFSALRVWRSFSTADDGGTVAMISMLGLVYLAMLFPRAGIRMVYDRYLLVVMPIASLAAIYAWSRSRPTFAIPRPAWAAMIVMAAIGWLVTFDHFAELRARATAARSLIERGVPRDRIENGITYDAWTQLEVDGYINDHRIRHPATAYSPHANDARREATFWFLPRTPAVTPQYVIETVPTRPAATNEMQPTAWSFVGLLPPGRRWLALRIDPDAVAAGPQVAVAAAP